MDIPGCGITFTRRSGQAEGAVFPFLARPSKCSTKCSPGPGLVLAAPCCPLFPRRNRMVRATQSAALLISPGNSGSRVRHDQLPNAVSAGVLMPRDKPDTAILAIKAL